MKILRLLNKIFFTILILLITFTSNLYSEDEPVDIWNIDKSKVENTESTNENQNSEEENLSQISISNNLKIQSQSLITETTWYRAL